MVKQQEKNGMGLKHTSGEFTNPFEGECDQLINMVTNAALPKKIQEDMTRGQRVQKRNLCSLFQREQQQTM